MNLKRINARIFYNDTFSVFRLEKNVASDKSTYQTLNAVASLQNKPCRVSKVSQDEAKNNNPMANPIVVGLMLFTHLSYEIMPGDTIEVQKQGEIKRYIAGEPYQYDNHQQLLLHRESEA